MSSSSFAVKCIHVCSRVVWLFMIICGFLLLLFSLFFFKNPFFGNLSVRRDDYFRWLCILIFDGHCERSTKKKTTDFKYCEQKECQKKEKEKKTTRWSAKSISTDDDRAMFNSNALKSNKHNKTTEFPVAFQPIQIGVCVKIIRCSFVRFSSHEYMRMSQVYISFGDILLLWICFFFVFAFSMIRSIAFFLPCFLIRFENFLYLFSMGLFLFLIVQNHELLPS